MNHGCNVSSVNLEIIGDREVYNLAEEAKLKAAKPSKKRARNSMPKKDKAKKKGRVR